MSPQPCRYCGEPVSRDIQGQYFATDLANEDPWYCPKGVFVFRHAPSENEEQAQ